MGFGMCYGIFKFKELIRKSDEYYSYIFCETSRYVILTKKHLFMIMEEIYFYSSDNYELTRTVEAPKYLNSIFSFGNRYLLTLNDFTIALYKEKSFELIDEVEYIEKNS
jgi:hypothetical protein